MVEMVVNVVSTRKVRAVVEELCSTEFSKYTVSALCKGLDDNVQEWNEQDLGGQEYPFFWWILGHPGAERRPGTPFKRVHRYLNQPGGIPGDLRALPRGQRSGGHLVRILRPAQGV